MYMRWMMFVDGENLTIRAQQYANKLKRSVPKPHIGDTFWWSGSIETQITRTREVSRLDSHAWRKYYYTCATGDEDFLASTYDKIQRYGFSPVVIKKVKGMRAKGVDISLTKDMLVQAFLNNYDAAVLVTGDGDYVPLIEEVRRLGKNVLVLFFDEENGLSPEIRRAADLYISIDWPTS